MSTLLEDNGAFIPFTHEDNFPSLESIEVVGNANDNIASLLKLQFPEFINAVVSPKVSTFLVSFLCFKLRKSDKSALLVNTDATADVPKAVAVKFRQSMSCLSRRVLCVFHRALFDPLRTSFLSDHDYGQFLYDNFIFDVPKMFDLACLYATGQTNAAVVSAILHQVFALQPKYHEDLRESFQHMASVLSSISSKVASARKASSSSKSSTTSKAQVSQAKPQNISAIVGYSTEIVLNARSILKSYPAGALCMVEQTGGTTSPQFVLPLALQTLYEQTLPYLFDTATDTHTQGVVAGVQNMILSIFDVFMQQWAVLPLRKRQTRETAFSSIVQLFSVLIDNSAANEGASECSAFLLDFNFKFNFVQKIAKYQSPQKAFIEGIFPDAEVLSKHILAMEQQLEAQKTRETHESIPSSNAKGGSTTGNAGAGTTHLHSDAMKQNIAQIKMLLPNLGDGYVAACLDAVAVDLGRENGAEGAGSDGAGVERAINCLLEHNFPSHMVKVPESGSLQDYIALIQHRHATSSAQSSTHPKSKKNPGTKKSYKNRPQNIVFGDSVDTDEQELEDEQLRQKVLRAFGNYSVYNDDVTDDVKYDPTSRVSVEPITPHFTDDTDTGRSGGGMVAVANPNHQNGRAKTTAEQLLRNSEAESAPRALAARSSTLFNLQTQLQKLDRKDRSYAQKSAFIREQIRLHKQNMGISRNSKSSDKAKSNGKNGKQARGSNGKGNGSGSGNGNARPAQFGRQRNRKASAGKGASTTKQPNNQRPSGGGSSKSPANQSNKNTRNKAKSNAQANSRGPTESTNPAQSSKNSARSRRHKQQNKSRIANHRRKAGALKKQGAVARAQ